MMLETDYGPMFLYPLWEFERENSELLFIELTVTFSEALHDGCIGRSCGNQCILEKSFRLVDLAWQANKSFRLYKFISWFTLPVYWSNTYFLIDARKNLNCETNAGRFFSGLK